MKGVDLSGPSTGNKEVPVAAFQAMKQDRTGIAVIGAWDGLAQYAAAEATAKNATTAGLLTAGYTALTPSVKGDMAVNIAYAAFGMEAQHLEFMAIDAEIYGITNIHIDAAEKRILALGMRPIIYTAPWFWNDPRGMNGSTAFAGLPLWNAHYDGNPDVNFQNAPYGGWVLKKLAGEQYTGTTTYCGVSVDMNTFSDDFLLGAPQNPLAALAAAWERDFIDLTVGASTLIHDHGATERALLYSIYATNRAKAWDALIHPAGK